MKLQARRHMVTITNYEARSNPADHKTEAFNSVLHQIQWDPANNEQTQIMNSSALWLLASKALRSWKVTTRNAQIMNQNGNYITFEA